MTNTIEATANSLKLSYLRFVSDAAPGLLLIAALVMVDPKLLGFNPIPQDSAVRAVLAVTGLLLASPLGLLVNGAGHFLLGSLQSWLNRRCFGSQRWPVADTHQMMMVPAWRAYFHVRECDWPAVAQQVDEILETAVPQLAGSIDHVRALKKLCRSIALIALVIAFIVAGAVGAVAVLAVIVGMAIGASVRGALRHVAPILAAGAVIGVVISCWKESPRLMIAVFLIVCGFLLLSGLVDFYQRGLTMLFLYQLLVEDREDASFRITPAEVRKRLDLLARTRRPEAAREAGGD